MLDLKDFPAASYIYNIIIKLVYSSTQVLIVLLTSYKNRLRKASGEDIETRAFITYT